jgi:hydrogenase maturation protease
MGKSKRDLIVGVGNILLSDDGIGIHIIRRLEKEKALSGSDFLDMGTSSMDLGYYINENIRKMVIIDSIRSEEKPGTIFRLSPEDLVSKNKETYSLHQLKLIDTLKLTSIETDFPDTIILGVVPHDVSTFSESLSPEILKKFSYIYDRILGVIKDFLEK